MLINWRKFEGRKYDVKVLGELTFEERDKKQKNVLLREETQIKEHHKAAGGEGQNPSTPCQNVKICTGNALSARQRVRKPAKICSNLLRLTWKNHIC